LTVPEATSTSTHAEAPHGDQGAPTDAAPKQWEWYRDLILTLVSKEFKVRYKSTILGYAWSLLHPLLFAMVFFFVFRMIMRFEQDHYALILISGLFPWHWFQNSVAASNLFFLGNAPLIKKVRFPRSQVVLAGVLNDLIHYVISLPVILLFMWYYGFYPTLAWLWVVPTLVVVQFALTFGVSLFVATCNLFFRDLQRLVEILLMAWFYLTPVIYPLSVIPEEYRWGVYVNPMASMIVSWRGIFLDGEAHWAATGAATGFALLAMGIGLATYCKLRGRFAEVV